MKNYAVTPCSCGNLRVIDLSSETSDCPYCGKSINNESARVLYSDVDPKAARDALARLTGFEAPPRDPEVRKRIEEADPLSTLEYKYEGCSDAEQKMELLAQGLTKIYGTFTIDDVRKVEGRDPEKILKGMIELCIVFEAEPGRYKI
ncbi:MAG: hypothetical protein VB016_00935 [Methanomassiliicoccaceae archaeon]|nr:hypothetical protein [Methanomassiliicoccaceae archaeon]